MHPPYTYVAVGERYKVLEKKVGDTPLQVLEELRSNNEWLQGISLTYAGRLDPMAEGKLLILIGNECKKRERYNGLDKEYEFEVLLGFSSDTGDVLGVAEASGERYAEPSGKELEKVVRSFIGTHEINYPAFSSKTINGTPLFQHALQGTLPNDMPTTTIHIYRMEYLGAEIVETKELVGRVVNKINTLQAPADSGKIGADFRKKEIIERWHSFKNVQNKEYTLLKFKAVVSSGTYIRVLAPLIAERLGVSGLAYSIHRTKIGRYQTLTGHFGFWRKTFT
ncbi:MAG: tRNA pseudouridine55 synthase [Parcubacteria group bacterium Greene0714_7]|nr:MAG: tRNA pseudouridine55 synthase [Parcubacteria group bacterium Greene0714_7]